MADKAWLDGSEDGGGEANLSRSDLSALPSDKLIDIIAWQRNGLELMDERLQKAETEAAGLKTVVNRLSIDPTSGVFTSGALVMMTDVLIGSRILEFLKVQGFTLKLCMLDVDEVKRHNQLGGPGGGDAVLAEVSKRLRILFRRRSDVVAQGVADFINEVTGPSALTNAQAKTEKGDEMVAWRFAPPTKDDARRGGWKVSSEASRIRQGFDGASVSYPLIEGITEADIKLIDPEGRFKIKSGIVTAPISVTFACIYAPMPVSRAEIRRVVRRAHELILKAKNSRGGTFSRSSVGEGLKLTEEDLNLP